MLQIRIHLTRTHFMVASTCPEEKDIGLCVRNFLCVFISPELEQYTQSNSRAARLGVVNATPTVFIRSLCTPRRW